MINYAFSFYDLEYYLLILVRVSTFIFVAPFFSMTNTPRPVRIVLSLFISYVLYNAITPAQAVYTESILGLAIIVIKEAIVGLLVGFSANIAITILNFAGHLADMETGLTMVQAMDPTNKEMATITGSLYSYSFNMMMILSGLYMYLLGALRDTYTLIPINGAIFNGASLVNSIMVFMRDYILIGFRIILPIFCAVLILNAVLGIIAKVSPQMNMFSIGIQLKILTGLSVLVLTVGLLPSVSEMIYTEIKKMMIMFVGTMV